MRLALSLGLVTVSLGVFVWACGSVEPNADLTAPAADGGPAPGTSSSSSGANGPNGGSDGSSGDGSSGGPTGGDGGIDPPDARPGGDTTRLTCGATSCALPGEQCCVARIDGPGNVAFGCVADGGGCAQAGNDGTLLRCSGAANCAAGTVCCVRETNNGAASECKATCGGNEAQLCDPSSGTSGCPTQQPCSNDEIRDWGLPPTYATCGGRGN